MEHRRESLSQMEKKNPPSSPDIVDWEKRRSKVKLLLHSLGEICRKLCLEAFVRRSKLFRSAACIEESAFRCHYNLTTTFPKFLGRIRIVWLQPTYTVDSSRRRCMHYLHFFTEAIMQRSQQSWLGKWLVSAIAFMPNPCCLPQAPYLLWGQAPSETVIQRMQMRCTSPPKGVAITWKSSLCTHASSLSLNSFIIITHFKITFSYFRNMASFSTVIAFIPNFMENVCITQTTHLRNNTVVF